MERLREAVRLEPKSPEIRLVLALALLSAGDRAGAVREYDEALRGDDTLLSEVARAAWLAAERGDRSHP